MPFLAADGDGTDAGHQADALRAVVQVLAAHAAVSEGPRAGSRPFPRFDSVVVNGYLYK
jgi:hypothetical protein